MPLRRLALLVLVAALLLAPATALGSGSQGHPRELTTISCTVVKIADRGYVLYRQGVSCTWARRWASRLAASHGRRKPTGFKCTSGAGFRGNAWCERGGKHFGWDSGAY